MQRIIADLAQGFHPIGMTGKEKIGLTGRASPPLGSPWGVKLRIWALKGLRAIPQSRAQLNRSGLPSETLKCGSLESGGSAGSAEGAVLRTFTPWLIAKMCRFKFSPERPLRS
jgi:hypothetical protein